MDKKQVIREKVEGIKVVITFMKAHGEKGMDVLLKELNDILELLDD